MSWREQQAANSVSGRGLRGSFRSAEFTVPTNDLEFGRRTKVHEFPLRDDPYVEDLGRKARRFSVEVFVAGLGYMAARDALIAEIEKPGDGLLTHPYYGILNVTVVDAKVRETSREGGKATFNITFVEAGAEIFPTSETDTASSTDAAATVASDSAIAAFAKRFSVEGLTGWSITALESEMASTLAGVTKLVGGVAGTIAAEIRAPYNMAGLIVGSIQQIATLADEPFEALRLYKGLFDAGSDSRAIPTTTATCRQQAQSTAALQELTRASSVIEACRAASQADFAASDDALTARDDMLDAIEARMQAVDPVTGAPIDNALFDALRALRAAMVQDLRVRGAKLPRITYYTPAAVLPARVLAYRIYGDASRAEEIVARNKISHPGFVPGGVALEVLADA